MTVLIAGTGELTITSVAAAARVSRRTIYAHWGTIEDLVADSVFDTGEVAARNAFLRIVRDPLRLLPAIVREVVARPTG